MLGNDCASIRNRLRGTGWLPVREATKLVCGHSDRSFSFDEQSKKKVADVFDFFGMAQNLTNIMGAPNDHTSGLLMDLFFGDGFVQGNQERRAVRSRSGSYRYGSLTGTNHVLW